VSTKVSKRRALQEARAFNAHPERVQAIFFHGHPFFDPEDKAQVKYEMLRRRELEGAPLVETCQEFGFTRESYRHIVERFRLEGMAGLFEKKRGRRQPLKVTESVRQWLNNAHEREPNLGAEELAQRLEEQSGVRLSRRTVYRALAHEKKTKKKRRSKK
jgi:transposase